MQIRKSANEESLMIDFDTIEDVDDCDGEAVFAYGFDPLKQEWVWEWVPLEDLAEADRRDILQRLGVG